MRAKFVPLHLQIEPRRFVMAAEGTIDGSGHSVRIIALCMRIGTCSPAPYVPPRFFAGRDFAERTCEMSELRATGVAGSLLALVLLSACGGDGSVASKSAEAYREAVASGKEIGAGHEHGGHAVDTATGAVAGMDRAGHSASDASGSATHVGHAATAGGDHAAMGHSTSGGAHAGHTATRAGAVDHSAMGHGATPSAHAGHSAVSARQDHAAMGHAPASNAHRGHASTPAGSAAHSEMRHGATGTAAHAGHESMPAASGAHAQHTRPSTATPDAHAQHTRPSATSADPHAQHRQPSTTTTDPHAHHGQPSTTTPDPHAQHGQSPAAAPAHAHHGQTPSASPAHGMMHGSATSAADPHAGHAAGSGPGDTVAPPLLRAPRSSDELLRLAPAATLRPDRLDTPAPISVSEAAKAAADAGHEGHGTRSMAPGADRENPPTPMPATRDGHTPPPAGGHGEHGSHPSGSATQPAAAIYTCPMHPEVTSDRPGTCPKCGMALVKKN
jgi:hypothetical protein